MNRKYTSTEFAEYVKPMNTACLNNYFNVKVRFQPSKDNYELIKKRFYEFITAFYKCQSSIIDKEYTRDRIEYFIREIIISRDLKLSELNQLQKNLISKYEILMNNGENKLYLKRLCTSDSLMQVAASEDCFDYIAAVLRTEELSIKEAMSRLSTSYYIPEVYYATFGKLCMEMTPLQIKGNSNSSEKSFGVSAQVIILSMCKEPDLDYKYILLYVDKGSRFVLLRPMMTISKNEMSMELLKIFLDFGPPKIIECSLFISGYFIDVSQVMNSIYPQLELPVFKYFKNSFLIIDVMDIYNLIKTWCEHNRCKNWSIGIYVIQWLINSNGDNSPYNTVFKHRQNDVKTMSKKQCHREKDVDRIKIEEPQAIDDEIVNENTTNINVTLHTEKDLGINVKIEPDIKIENDCISSMIDFPGNDLTRDFSTTDNILFCKECNIGTNENIKCGQCKKYLHFYCKFTDILKEFSSKITLSSLCRLCVIVNQRVEELKTVIK